MILAGIKCDRCNEACSLTPENEYGEVICADCESNANERAYERYCEAYHDGGSVQFRSLLDQQIEARRLK